MESALIKELRDTAALAIKMDPNPFEARRRTCEWRAADLIEVLEAVMASIGRIVDANSP